MHLGLHRPLLAAVLATAAAHVAHGSRLGGGAAPSKRGGPSFAPNGLSLPGAFDDFLCTPVLKDTAGRMWQFNLAAVANASVTGSDGTYTWPVSPCGVHAFACTSPGNPVTQVYAPVSQVWGGNPPGGQCPNPATGGTSPCTQTCKPLGHGPPRYELLDYNNASAGVVTRFNGIKPAPADGGSCGFDPTTGSRLERTVAIIHKCDPAVPMGTVVWVGQQENPSCQYHVTIKVGVGGAGMVEGAVWSDWGIVPSSSSVQVSNPSYLS